MAAPQGFHYEEMGEQVTIFHHGRKATVLRGTRAASFLTDVEAGNAQDLMARRTGNYKRGNERQARDHPRNRGAH